MQRIRVHGLQVPQGNSMQRAGVQHCLRKCAADLHAHEPAYSVIDLHPSLNKILHTLNKYPSNWEGLNFDRLKEIEAECKDVPLVLHGGSGIPSEMVQRAIRHGVCKVNVNTELQLGFAAKIRAYIEEGKDLEDKGFDPRKLLKPGCEGIEEVVKEKLDMFFTTGKAE